MAKKHALRTAQSEKYHGDEWWSWSVWIDVPPETLLDIVSVEYTLHPTFANPVRIIKTRANKFKLSSAGWGVFPIHVRIRMRDGKEYQLRHQLKLHYPSGKANTA
jgi:transcription initiation factor IIF auxiliary subunit